MFREGRHALYGTVMRIKECLRLRVKDIDFDMNQITIRDAKDYMDLANTVDRSHLKVRP